MSTGATAVVIISASVVGYPLVAGLVRAALDEHTDWGRDDKGTFSWLWAVTLPWAALNVIYKLPAVTAHGNEWFAKRATERTAKRTNLPKAIAKK